MGKLSHSDTLTISHLNKDYKSSASAHSHRSIDLSSESSLDSALLEGTKFNDKEVKST